MQWEDRAESVNCHDSYCLTENVLVRKYGGARGAMIILRLCMYVGVWQEGTVVDGSVFIRFLLGDWCIDVIFGVI